jgi:RNA polymerase sigma factor (sigma-70 family)
MARLADGDRAAFDPIYAALWPLLRGFTTRALAGAADADDAAAEVLVKVLSRASDYDCERDALSWVLGIAAWECRTVRQRARRRREEPPSDDTDHASNEPSPEEQAIARDLQAAAEAVISTLRPADAAVLRAVSSGQRPDVAAATFRKRVERALGRLRLAWRRSRHGIE